MSDCQPWYRMFTDIMSDEKVWKMGRCLSENNGKKKNNYAMFRDNYTLSNY